MVPRRRRDGLVLRALRADREPERSRPRRCAVDYLLPGRRHARASSTRCAPESRFTIYVDDEQLPAGSGQRPLASTAVAMRVTVDQRRAHHRRASDVVASAGLVRGAQRSRHDGDGYAVGRWRTATSAGPSEAETYVLDRQHRCDRGVAARVAVLRGRRGRRATTGRPLPPKSRTNVADQRACFPRRVGRRFSTLIESIGAAPVPIVVERAMYESPGGVTWAAGTAVPSRRG